MSWCETEMQKYMPLVKQNVMKFEVFILGGQRIDQKRNKGWWRGSRERIEMEAQKVTELTIEEEDKEHLHLPLLVSSRSVSSEFPTRFCSKALQQAHTQDFQKGGSEYRVAVRTRRGEGCGKLLHYG